MSVEVQTFIENTDVPDPCIDRNKDNCYEDHNCTGYSEYDTKKKRKIFLCVNTKRIKRFNQKGVNIKGKKNINDENIRHFVNLYYLLKNQYNENKKSFDFDFSFEKYKELLLLKINDKLNETDKTIFIELLNLGPITYWDVSQVTNMHKLFKGFTNFNEPLYWDVGKVTNMSHMFYDCEKFDSELKGTDKVSEWNVETVENMTSMFNGCKIFNQPLKWNVEKVKDMSFMFRNCNNFNKPLYWDVGKVTNMSDMFYGCENFNSELKGTDKISDWNVETVENMSNMFENCKKFNQPLNWNVYSLGMMYYNMFNGCTSLIKPITFRKKDDPNYKIDKTTIGKSINLVIVGPDKPPRQKQQIVPSQQQSVPSQQQSVPSQQQSVQPPNEPPQRKTGRIFNYAKNITKKAKNITEKFANKGMEKFREVREKLKEGSKILGEGIKHDIERMRHEGLPRLFTPINTINLGNNPNTSHQYPDQNRNQYNDNFNTSYHGTLGGNTRKKHQRQKKQKRHRKKTTRRKHNC